MQRPFQAEAQAYAPSLLYYSTSLLLIRMPFTKALPFDLAIDVRLSLENWEADMIHPFVRSCRRYRLPKHTQRH